MIEIGKITPALVMSFISGAITIWAYYAYDRFQRFRGFRDMTDDQILRIYRLSRPVRGTLDEKKVAAIRAVINHDRANRG